MTDAKALRERIRGPVFSILTPFDPESEAIAWDVLESYLQRIYDAGGRIFYVMAYNSRYSQLEFDEIRELNAFVVRAAKAIDPDNFVIVGDPPHCSTRVSIEFARHAEAAGADLISLLVRERFFFEEQIFRHYQMVAEACGLGILIHEMPFLNGLGGPPVNWPIPLLDRVADLPSVVAIKEDAKDDDYSREVVRTLRDRLAIVISGGGKRQWMRFADEGCQAWLNGIGVFAPGLATNFWDAWQRGDEPTWRRIIEEIEVPFFEHGVHRHGWHLTIKAALEARGVMSRHDRMPLMPLPDAEAKQVAELIEAMPVDELARRAG